MLRTNNVNDVSPSPKRLVCNVTYKYPGFFRLRTINLAHSSYMKSR